MRIYSVEFYGTEGSIPNKINSASHLIMQIAFFWIGINIIKVNIQI